METGFIDKNYSSNNLYLPQLITNNRLKNKKVLSTILNELRTCDEFYFLVAFFTKSGVALSRINIYERVWEDEFIQGNRIIDVYIRKLKNKLSTFDSHIESLQGRGYILRETL